LDSAGVLAGSGADLLGDVDALLVGLEEGDKLGNVLALSLGLEVASLLRDLLDNGFLLVEALLGSRAEDTARGTAKLTGNLLTVGLGGVLLHSFLLGSVTLLDRPFGALLLGGVTLSHIFALLFLDGSALNNIILNFVFVVTGLADRLVDSFTFFGTFTVTDEGSMAELDFLIKSDLLVFDEARFLEVLFALLLLLGLEVGGVGGVTTLGVRMVALDFLVIFGLLNHDDLVDTTLTSSSDGSNAQVKLVITSTLTGSTSVFVVMVLVVSMGGMSSGTRVSGVEGEGVDQGLAVADVLGLLAGGGGGHKGDNAKLSKTNHDYFGG
jgi:hypothetical protein